MRNSHLGVYFSLKPLAGVERTEGNTDFQESRVTERLCLIFCSYPGRSFRNERDEGQGTLIPKYGQLQKCEFCAEAVPSSSLSSQMLDIVRDG
jgi:Fe-S-cluster-containing dehydrogenase component